MRKLTDEELKEYQLIILDKVHECCAKHGLTYFLSAGTLIGAVRHNGYIPWDDDIDIDMPREDYDKFVEVFNQENKDFRVYSVYKDKGYNMYFCKICYTKSLLVEEDCKCNDIDLGVAIDLFPLDKFPIEINDKKILRKLHLYDKLMFGKAYRFSEINKRPLKQRLLIVAYWLAALPFTKKFLGKRQADIARKYNDTNTDCYGSLIPPMSKAIPRWKKEDMIAIEHEFEGRMYNIPSGYHRLLTERYGDYMEFPPEDQRQPKHGFIAYIEE